MACCDKQDCFPILPKDHFPDGCNIVTNANTRKKMLHCQSRCFVCTKKGHNFKYCKSKRTCFRCKGPQHTSICQGDSYNAQPGGDKADIAGQYDKKKDNESDRTEDGTQNDSQGEVLLANTAVSNRRVVLMQTANIIATNGEDNYNSNM